MSGKIFYRKRLVPDECGLTIVTDRFVSIHETPHFHFCVPEHDRRMLRILCRNGETELSSARSRKLLKRIDKRASRIAFETEDEAMINLRYLKRRQLAHIKRDAVFIEKFLSTDKLENIRGNQIIPDSEDLVREYFVFD